MNAPVSLSDKYAATSGHVYLNGSQALVRLPIMQRMRDAANNLRTAGFISGYRGSPLGIYDLALWQAMPFLEQHDIRFQPGVNEDLAATAIWGSQQTGLIGPTSYDGVFGMWYGKGPGVDRSGDALKHGSYAGASEYGGVLALCGDDHGARSSTVAHQSDHALVHFGMPVFNPAHLQDYLDLGLAGFAMSRYAGTWIGFKCITDTVETSARVNADPHRLVFRRPDDFVMPPEGLNIRMGVIPLAAEARQYDLRLEAAKAFARANGIDQQVLGGRGARRLGIVTSGKATLDVMEALRLLGLDAAAAEAAGIAVYKLGMSWPVEPVGMRAFVEGCREVLVIEEKRGLIEEQLAHLLFNLPASQRPVLSGKRDPSGAPLVSQVGELAPASVMRAIRARLLASDLDAAFRARIERAEATSAAAEVIASAAGLMRAPSFCAGCPHNTSTNVPEGSVAMGGIGCHGLATWLPERRTITLYHMGGEGAAWIGQAPFSDIDHIFQNLGDGTYFHSGLLAIRACVTANVNITYKILLNGAIAMTGGQPIEGESFDGSVSAPHVVNQLHAEGVKKIAVVSDDPARHDRSAFPASVSFHHRDELDSVQKTMREVEGVTAIVYDQACATERRRLRKRGKVADPDRRMFIMPEVCEGCGDCGVQSNCVAIEPEETPLGRKRRINQSVCNKDFSCVKGLCPSFITVEGATPRKAGRVGATDEDEGHALPLPQIPAINDTCSIMIAGIGGNGVVTVGAILGMAAHIEGVGVSVLDISGLAQRNGPVTSHVRLMGRESGSHAARIPEGGADLVIACDLVVSAGGESVSRMTRDRTRVIYNRFVAPTSAFATNPDLDFGDSRLAAVIAGKVGEDALSGIDATRIALARLGDAIGANMLLVGYAWQKGLIPLKLESLEQAIQLNGAAVQLNLTAFRLGRLAAIDPDAQARWTKDRTIDAVTQTLDEKIEARAALLTAFDGPQLAERYRALVTKASSAETALSGNPGDFTDAVARGYFKALYYKDEYEVARLFTDGTLERRLRENFDGALRLRFNLAPPLLSRRGPDGREQKREFGPWVLPLFRLLARLKPLRGTAFDIFGMNAHRRTERALGSEYADLTEKLIARLNAGNLAAAAKIAAAYENVKGYGVVKENKLATVREQVARGLAALEEA
ncbi:indolepyruvate ferredoxin oxidoreductase family protein [Novosphingobium sp. ES2-1]|uniref:indolepyruvate ferredoxin oxidoreductase family protein n=1 Tax=Novosphingobium sp. ES2-1 TaxID=2780074 RepID=UPI00188128F1|nr:indolepyruvate ferredoxin oxidoreductase family protein [Novosphingobium sp. ES2-1]QOV96414.1 indolepyruvate ferredoxin oxidoreductase family protein [Novosphingobium sp. ES2-1]